MSLRPATEEDWEREFPHGVYQHEMSLDTGLRLTDGTDAILEFQGREFWWANAPDLTICPLLVYHADREQPGEDYQRAMRLISRLSFDSQESISEMLTIGRHRFGRARAYHPRHLAGLRVMVGPYLGDESVSNPAARDRARAYYREGLNSRSVYTSFLSYYKVLQLAFGEDRWRDLAKWILANIDRCCFHNDYPELLARAGSRDDIPQYLYASCRCAIAHTGSLTQKAVDPDNWQDHDRISRDLSIVQKLARRAIDDGAGIYG